eukprot:UN05640
MSRQNGIGKQLPSTQFYTSIFYGREVLHILHV